MVFSPSVFNDPMWNSAEGLSVEFPFTRDSGCFMFGYSWRIRVLVDW